MCPCKKPTLAAANMSALHHSVALAAVMKRMVPERWKSPSASPRRPTTPFFCLFFPRPLQRETPHLRQQPRDARTRGEKRCRCAHDGVDEGDGQVTHLPQWRGEPTAASAASAGRPSSLRAVRARSVPQRCSPEMERPPLKPARPQCYTPPPHGPNLPSVSTWHDDVGSLLRSALLRPPPPEKKEVKGG